VKKEEKEVKPKHNKIRLLLKHLMFGGYRHLGKIYMQSTAGNKINENVSNSLNFTCRTRYSHVFVHSEVTHSSNINGW
jgi:hypothetical protein